MVVLKNVAIPHRLDSIAERPFNVFGDHLSHLVVLIYYFSSPSSLRVHHITLHSAKCAITQGLPVPPSPADPLDAAQSGAELGVLEKTVQKVKKKR